MAYFNTEWFNGLCAELPRPYLMTIALKIWLTKHFEEVSNRTTTYGDEGAGQVIWTPNPETGIVIEPITKWLPRLTEARPAILIKRGDWKRIKLGIGDRYHTPNELGKQYFENWWQGTHILLCISGEAAEAENISAEVSRLLNTFGWYFLKIMNLKKFEVVQIGELKLLQEGRDNFFVPVVIEYIFGDSWTVQPLNEPELSEVQDN
ncbi:MAG: hypothetical protein QXH92_04145 [Candidatus Aenigmatarchaeota archaeon]